MKPIPLYSLVIIPSLEQSNLVKHYKELLKNNIGWFNSANSAAHITIINFDNEVMLTLYFEQIREFCKTLVPQEVTLDTFDSFGDKTFFIAPNETSQHYLKQIIADLHKHLDFKIKNTHAHLSIARGLDSAKMKTAYKVFKTIDVYLRFNCDAFYLRKFNKETNQYSNIVEKINFGIY